MAKTTTIELLEKRPGFQDETVERVILREPKAREFFSLGEPTVMARSPDGTVFATERPDVVADYIAACVIEPSSKAVLDNLSLADAMRVKAAMLDFFGNARELASPIGATSSSST